MDRLVVGAMNWITPAHELEDHFFPQAFWMVDAYHERIAPIPGYTAKKNYTEINQLENNKKGIQRIQLKIHFQAFFDKRRREIVSAYLCKKLKKNRLTLSTDSCNMANGA